MPTVRNQHVLLLPYTIVSVLIPPHEAMRYFDPLNISTTLRSKFLRPKAL